MTKHEELLRWCQEHAKARKMNIQIVSYETFKKNNMNEELREQYVVIIKDFVGIDYHVGIDWEYEHELCLNVGPRGHRVAWVRVSFNQDTIGLVLEWERNHRVINGIVNNELPRFYFNLADPKLKQEFLKTFQLALQDFKLAHQSLGEPERTLGLMCSSRFCHTGGLHVN
jgi:hypothetical protein